MINPLSEIGTRLANLRAEQGLKRYEAAEQLRVSKSLLSRFELGRSAPTPQFIINAARLYRVNSQELLALTAECLGETAKLQALQNWAVKTRNAL